MIETRNWMAAFALGLLAACDSAEPPPMAPPEAGAAAAADRFIPYFQERCLQPLSAGAAPDTNLLVPASDDIIGRYPRAGDYVELDGRRLSFWMEPQDERGSVILVLEATEDTDRCAVITDGFTADAFAGKLKSSYPEYLERGDDEQVIKARISIAAGDRKRSSRIFTTYHDPARGVSALIMTVSETGG